MEKILNSVCKLKSNIEESCDWSSRQKAQSKASYWFAAHNLLILLSCTTQECPPRGRTAHFGVSSLTSIINKKKKYPTDMPTGQPCRGNSSIETPFPKIILIHVRLTKINQNILVDVCISRSQMSCTLLLIISLLWNRLFHWTWTQPGGQQASAILEYSTMCRPVRTIHDASKTYRLLSGFYKPV